MLKVSPQYGDTFHEFKCGEIFCNTASVFKVSCCLCDSKMHLEQFLSHFQNQHLALAEETIHFDLLKKKNKIKVLNDWSLLEPMPIKEDEPTEIDDIKQEKELECKVEEVNTTVEATEEEEDVDDICLQDRINASKSKRNRRNCREKIKDNTDSRAGPRKHLSRKANKAQEFIKEEEIETPLHVKQNDEESDATPLLVEELNNELPPDNVLEKNEEYDEGAEMQWSDEEKDSDSNVSTCYLCKAKTEQK